MSFSPLRGRANTPFDTTGSRATPAKATALPAADPYDVLILGGRVIDGTGNAWFLGDVALKDGRIARITPAGLLNGASGERANRREGAGRLPGVH